MNYTWPKKIVIEMTAGQRCVEGKWHGAPWKAGKPSHDQMGVSTVMGGAPIAGCITDWNIRK